MQDCSVAQIEAGLKEIQMLVAGEKLASGSPFDIAAGYVVRQYGESVPHMIHRGNARMYEEKARMKAAQGLNNDSRSVGIPSQSR